ncbi:MAG: hypothetical protein AAGG81_07060, partial [Chlamydiota bacterium]
KLFFEEDGRNWIFAGKTKVGEKTYVPENQDPQNWKEAIILHHINVGNIPLDVYYERFMKILNEKSGNIFDSTVIEQDEDHLIFEWWIDPIEREAQHGLIKVSRTPLGLQFFRYTTKNREGMGLNKDIWATILRDHDFSVVPQKVNVDVDFSLDGRNWDLVESSTINKEFILEGEDSNDWTEKLSIDVFSLKAASPYTFYYEMIQGIEDKTGNNVETKVIDSGLDHIIFEWKVDDSEQPHWSYYKMTVLDSKLASGMQYSSRFVEVDENVKSVWEEIMRKARANISYDYLLESDSSSDVTSQKKLP